MERYYFLLVLLMWAVLLNQAVILKKADTRKKETSEAQKEEENKAGAGGNEEKIRVLLMDSSYERYYHQEVTLSFDGKVEMYVHGQMKASLVTVEPCSGETQVLSLKRQQGCPRYPGKLLLRDCEEGILLINELALEEYLERVVPSEMPATYETEALKAQAVCARTYARKKMEESRFEEYGADLDDSVNDQVYNNISPQTETSEAVKETEGEVLCQNGELIEAYYFSTSAGFTSTDEIWGAVPAASFLKSVECSFDKEEPWSRWEVKIPWDFLEKQAAGKWETDCKVKNIEIVRKSISNAVTGLRIQTENSWYILENELEIRRFLSPCGLTVTRKNGEQVKGGNTLPSAYFTLDVDRNVSVTVSGSGYGHGVGMSQNAANHMAELGKSYRDILNYFFKDVDIIRLDTTSCM